MTEQYVLCCLFAAVTCSSPVHPEDLFTPLLAAAALAGVNPNLGINAKLDLSQLLGQVCLGPMFAACALPVVESNVK